MLIEVFLKNYLDEHLSAPAFFSFPEKRPGKFVLIERASGGANERLPNSTIAIQSYGQSKYDAMLLNQEVKEVMDQMESEPEISRVSLNSDYNFPDLERKIERYQAVFDIYHY